MSDLEKIVNTPMGIYTAIISELILFIVAFWFFGEDKTVEAVGILIIIEIRHFRYIWHKKAVSNESRIT